MRVIGNIPHPTITITVFLMNSKYVIKLEAGQMEQVFKINQSEIGGMEGIQKLLDEEFLKKVIARFNEMFLSFKQAREKV
jgi:hypothetical protein